MCERDIRAAVGGSRYCQAFRGALLIATVGVLAMSLVSDAAVADLLLTPDGGNAGIGTTTPTRKLTVVDDDGVQSGAHWIGEFSGETSELLLGYSADGTVVKNARIQSSGDLPLAIGVSGADDALWIAADGNVGVGSTNPSRRMTVVDDDGVANGVHWIGELAGQGTQLLLGYAADGSVVTNMRILSANSFPLSLGTSAANDAVWITADGEVGIGTTSPARPLTVKDDDGTSSGAHWIGEFAGEGSQLFIGYVGDGSAVTNMRVLSANSVPLALGTSGANDAVWIKSNGDVGIGTTSPQFLLHVNGSAGKPGGGSWSASSDRRLKKNVTVLTGALDRLAKLQGVNYEWRNPAQHQPGTRAGFIAQDVEDVFPEWVSQAAPLGDDQAFVGEGEAVKVLAFPHDFNAYLVEAIKELKAENEALRQQLMTLSLQQATLVDLGRQLEVLRRKFDRRTAAVAAAGE